MSLVYIGLGSNLGNRLANITGAREELLKAGSFEIVKMSSVEETAPVDFLEQPAFLNQIILVKTEAAPEELLSLLQSIEKKMGRVKTIPKGPRIIDLDILLYNDLVLDSPALIIPHPEIKKRSFVLKHLLEINPRLTDPGTGERYSTVYDNLE